jgi:predicted Zn-dependent protease
MNKKWHRHHLRNHALRVQRILLNKHFTSSEPLLRAAIRRDPNVYALHSALANLLIRRDRHRQALTVWRQMVGRFPRTANPYFQRAYWALDLQNFGEAEKYLRLCLRYDHGYFGETAYFWRAEALFRLGRHREAKAQLVHVRDGHVEHWFLDYERRTKEDLASQIQAAEAPV